MGSPARKGTVQGELSSYELRIPIASDSDILTARAQVRTRVMRLGFATTEMVRIVTAVSELARNMLMYAGNGVLTFRVASLYPLLYRLEKRGWIQGRWIEKAGQRRRRYYKLTTSGANVLASQRDTWKEFAEAINRIAGLEQA